MRNPKAMFRKTILLFFAVMFYACPAFAQNYIVTPEALNIRSGPGMQHEIIGKFKQGDKVSVEEFVGNWAKIKTSDGAVAFISKNFIKIEEKPKDRTPLILLGTLLLALYILLRRLKKRFNSRCKQCKKWGALREYSKELIDTTESNIVKITKTTNGQGKVTSRKENLVPATVYQYKVIEECKYCGHKVWYTYSRKVEN